MIFYGEISTAHLFGLSSHHLFHLPIGLRFKQNELYQLFLGKVTSFFIQLFWLDQIHIYY